MPIIQSQISTTSNEFLANKEAFQKRVEELHRRRGEVKLGGPAKARELHKKRNQMMVRDRIKALCDPGSPFLELGMLVGLDLHNNELPSGGFITGVGLIHGRRCMILAHDATVKGGSYYALTAKKHVRAQMYAWKHRLPCITLVQSGGANLPEQPGIFPDDGQMGSIFYNQIMMSAEGIPQIAIVHGPSTAGGAYMPALCDEAVIVREQGYMYLGSPTLVEAATGEIIDAESLGGGEMHCKVSGVTDHLAENDSHAIAITRDIVERLGNKPDMRWQVAEAVPPRHDPAEIYGLINHDHRIPNDTHEILCRLIDDSNLQEFKPHYGDTLICGFARIMGFEIGILANKGVLFGESALKGAHFISLCCQRDIPLLFMADVSGFMVGREAEQTGIAKHGAKLISAMAAAKVPKYTVVIGGDYGAGYLAMCGRAFKPDALFNWPNARTALMGPDQAAMVLAGVRQGIYDREGNTWPEDEKEKYKQMVRDDFDAFANAYNFAANLWSDDILDPVETREVLALHLDIAGRCPAEETRFPVFRF
ncbi:MAG: methylcrotonoyl-CoA carboxylase [Gammaproteobacteria bacterium]|nr:methylcrotonoyl-CoA carboxylase [Gammaproteobacteria bacterium]